jgi:hypothetical protein
MTRPLQITSRNFVLIVADYSDIAVRRQSTTPCVKCARQHHAMVKAVLGKLNGGLMLWTEYDVTGLST